MGYVYSHHMYHDLTVPVYTHINGVCLLTPHVPRPHRACLYTHQWGMCTHTTCITTSPCLSIHTSMGYVYSHHMYHDLTVPVYTHINGVCVLTPHVSRPHRACLYTHQWGMSTHTTCITTSSCLSIHTSMGYVYSHHMYHDLTVPVYTHINGVCLLTPHVSRPHRACLYTHQWGMCTHTTCITTSPCLSIHTSMGYVYSHHMYVNQFYLLERRNLPLKHITHVIFCINLEVKILLFRLLRQCYNRGIPVVTRWLGKWSS